jgi:serine/threonine protein kinase
VKVADFGLARRLDPGAAAHGHTTIGTVLGTPDYMAPEQMRGNSVDHRADIYSLGVMLYEMLCKEVPRGMVEPPSKRVTVDARVDEVVKKAMQHLPERRYQRTSEMRTAVEQIRETPLPRSFEPAMSDAAAKEIDRYSFMPKAVTPPPSSSKTEGPENASEIAAAHPEAGPVHEHASQAEPSRPKSRGLFWLLLIIVILLVLGAAAFVLLGPGKDIDWAKLPWPRR